MPEANQYIPGVCNIGAKEIARRKQAGHIGLVIFLVLGILLFVFHVARPVRLILFIPAVMSAVGYLQAYSHFCAAFGSIGVFNFGTELGKTDTVVQAEFRSKDRRKAIRIILFSVVIGLVATLAVYFL